MVNILDAIKGVYKYGVAPNIPALLRRSEIHREYDLFIKQDEEGNTALHLCVIHTRLDLLELFLKDKSQNIDLLIRNNAGSTALDLAWANANGKAIELLTIACSLASTPTKSCAAKDDVLDDECRERRSTVIRTLLADGSPPKSILRTDAFPRKSERRLSWSDAVTRSLEEEKLTMR